MFGVALLFERSPGLLPAAKLLGAAYLIRIGIKTACDNSTPDPDGTDTRGASATEALKTGFLCNASNPKTMLFVVSTFTQPVNPTTPLPTEYAYGVFISAVHWLWFSLVAVFFAHGTLRTAMLKRKRLFDRAIGTLLVGLGALLAGTNLV